MVASCITASGRKRLYCQKDNHMLLIMQKIENVKDLNTYRVSIYKEVAVYLVYTW